MKDSELQKRLAGLKTDFDLAWEKLNIEQKAEDLTEKEERLALPEIWNNPDEAQALAKQISAEKSLVQPWQTMKIQLADAEELLNLGEDDLADEIKQQIIVLENDFQKMRQQLLFTGKFDSNNAILRLSAGAGGVDAMDFTEMLERMYLRWAEKSGLEAKVIERSPGEAAGVKTSVIEINGPYAFGLGRAFLTVYREPGVDQDKVK